MMIRFLFIVSIIVWVATFNELLPIFTLWLLLLLVLRQQGFLVSNMYRTFKLLLWLFIPTMVFNGLFTPGVYVQQPFSMPFTHEGLSRGSYLCAHIGLVFFAALVVFRVFAKEEWFVFLDKSPLNLALKPYLLLLLALQNNTKAIVFEQKQVWLQMKQRWKHLPDMLITIVQQVIDEAKQEAHKLWLTWDEQMQSEIEAAASPSNSFAYLVPLTLGWGLFWLI